MPLHWRRRLSRGFNQSDLLAAELSRLTGVPVLSGVRRKRHTPPQSGLSQAGRRRNVTGSFDVPANAGVKDKRILLVDDVLTTGATASACAKALKRAGAMHVTAITVARADRRQWASVWAVPNSSTQGAKVGS